MERRWGRSRQWVRSFIKYLQKHQMITTTQATRRTTIITIQNYKKFNPGATTGVTTQVTTIKEIEEYKEKEYMEIPLKDGTKFKVGQEREAQLEKSYPRLPVKELLREIQAWNYANPGKRKTRTGVMRHINSWLQRASEDRRQRQEPDNRPTGRHHEWPKCPHCGIQQNSVIRGKPCPMCDKEVP
jgi:hypothetical protein